MADSSRAPVVVAGLGRFGESLALELMAEGVEVLGIDGDLQIVDRLAGSLTHVVRADSTDPEAMRQLSVHEFDRAVIGIGTNLEASLLTASVLVSMQVRDIWAKAVSAPHARILEQVGVHHVVRPEHDTGQRVAHLVRGRLLDYIEIDDGYAIVKVRAPRSIVDRRLAESSPRSRFGVTIVGVKRAGEEFTYATADTVVHDDDLLIVSGPNAKVERFTEQA